MDVTIGGDGKGLQILETEGLLDHSKDSLKAFSAIESRKTCSTSLKDLLKAVVSML